MNSSMKTVGGGSAKPVADSFNRFLLDQLQTGNLSQMFSGQNQPERLDFNTSADMNNPQFAAMQNFLQQQQTQNLSGLRERFQGPQSRGTPGAFAESSYLSQAAPQNVLAMGQLADSIRGQNRADLSMQGQYDLGRMGIDQNTMQMLMQGMMQSNQLGTPQAQMVQKPSDFSQILGAASSIAPFALAPFTGGASLGLAGMFGQEGVNNRRNMYSQDAPPMMNYNNLANANAIGLQPNPMWEQRWSGVR